MQTTFEKTGTSEERGRLGKTRNGRVANAKRCHPHTRLDSSQSFGDATPGTVREHTARCIGCEWFAVQ